MQYYKIVDAIQWTNGNEQEVIDFIRKHKPLIYAVYLTPQVKEVYNSHCCPEVIQRNLVDCIVIYPFYGERIEFNEGDFVVYEDDVFRKKSQFEFEKEYLEVKVELSKSTNV